MKSKVALREAFFEKDMCYVFFEKDMCYDAILEQSDFSKAKRKTEEQSETLPQVSEEIYDHLAADLKDLFGSSKEKPEKREETPWDKEDAEDSVPSAAGNLGPVPGNDVAQELSAFKFSFFGGTQEAGTKEGNGRTCPTVPFLRKSLWHAL